MSVFLRNISVKGIKNLSKKVELIFAKKEINSFSELEAYNVKAIYGANGSGKTAIVHAFQILHDIILKSGYLYDPDNTKNLFELMNKDCSKIDIEIEFFYSENNEKPIIYYYSIQLEYKNNQFEIAHEKYSKRTSEYAKEKVIVETLNGAFVQYELDDAIKNDFTNLLKKRSFAEILLETKYTEDSKYLMETDPLLSLVFSSVVILDEKDNHVPVFGFTLERLKEIYNYRLENQAIFKSAEETGYRTKILTKRQLKRYKSEITSKEKFIRLFKPSIKGIKVVSKLVKTSNDENIYLVNDFIDYGDYAIDIEFESIGLKKLMSLYNTFKHISKGGIVVIDELDSHINDVYLVKLVEYVSKFTKGQLIFTTHNVSPMEVLKSKKNSIDFM
ncbi:MAG: AAA family ATPase, partial [Acholeplasmataceae bacterium]